MAVSRRQVLRMGLAVPFAGTWSGVPARSAEPGPTAVLSWVRAGIDRDSNGGVVNVFGLDRRAADDVLLKVTRADGLRDGFAPVDLVSAATNGIPSAGRQLLRPMIVDDTRALIADAAREGNELLVGSGFRSQEFQADIFAAQIQRWGDEKTANRYSARAGHSQHQLGTTIDFTTTFGAFRRSPAAGWLRDNAHRFGFVLPYTAAAAARTGYVDEPWHSRWVGPILASRLQEAGYQDWTTLDADDIVALVRTEAELDSA